MHGTWAGCQFELMAARNYIVGVTGGIGSGKSTVAALFAKLGAAVIDTDAIAHTLTAPGGRAIGPIRTLLGEDYVADDGALDRVVTRSRVFGDLNIKRQLESILHPLIHEEVKIALRAEAVQMALYAMLIVPLLFETLAYRGRTDTTLLVDCAVAAQLARAQHRSGLSSQEVTRIVATQLPRAVRFQLADEVVWNGGGPDALRAQIEALHRRYTLAAGNAG